MSHARLIALATAANVAVTFDVYFVTLAVPSLPWSVESASWVLNAHAIVFGALLVPAGRLADAIGLRRAYMMGFALLGAGALASAAAPGLVALIAARSVEGAGAALLVPSALGIVIREIDERARPRALAIWMAGSATAAALGPAVAGALLEVSWRLGFVVVVPIAAAASLAVCRSGACARGERREGVADVLGSVLLVASLASLTAALVRGDVWLGGGAALGAIAFVVRSMNHSAPVLELSLLRAPGFAVALAVNALKYAAYGAWVFASFLLFTEVWGYSAFAAGAAVAPGAAVAGPAGFAGTRLLKVADAGRVAATGTLTIGAGIAWWLASASEDRGYAVAALPTLLLVGLGLGLSAPALTNVAMSALPDERAATGSATLMMSRQVGSTIGIAISIALVGATVDEDSLGNVWALCTAALVAAALATTALTRSAGVATRPRAA